jgi:hypothetical protein
LISFVRWHAAIGDHDMLNPTLADLSQALENMLTPKRLLLWFTPGCTPRFKRFVVLLF